MRGCIITVVNLMKLHHNWSKSGLVHMQKRAGDNWKSILRMCYKKRRVERCENAWCSEVCPTHPTSPAPILYRAGINLKDIKRGRNSTYISQRYILMGGVRRSKACTTDSPCWEI